MKQVVHASLALTALLAGCAVPQARPPHAPPKKAAHPAHRPAAPARPPKKAAHPPKTARPAAPPPAHAPPPPPPPRPEPQVLHLPGLESVIGADARTLTTEFGTPRIDTREGDARKLQFSGEACVLDIYLYPPDGGGEARATYLDARRASDGQAVDRAACVAALRQR